MAIARAAIAALSFDEAREAFLGWCASLALDQRRTIIADARKVT
jgi:hypothetical protein